eukprot:TRINITY_DN642_c0_g2_i1.p1 TRINITY_DN642_c0_g2~~TRINITY_DN642_c0_g2_i1.p1  ORF type:complete len:114 (-),score=42.01 TRINITY_DN642_c0_g2_i1:144-485(-)
MADRNGATVHTQHIEDVYEMPVSVINRPLISVLDHDKVESLMETIKVEETSGNVPPIDVLWLEKDGKDYYFAFGGCHRWEAHKRLNKTTIKAKLMKTDENTIRLHLGDSFKLK